MSEGQAAVRGVIVAHADLARGLVRAVERISGLRGHLVAVSNEGCGPEDLRTRIEEALAPGPAIVFADLASGSCAFAVMRVARRRADTAVLTGVSLPVLLDFVFHHEMPLSPLMDRLVEKGRGEIRAFLPREEDSEASRVDRPV